MTEVFKPIEGFDGYEVSNKGRVRSRKSLEPIILKPWLSKGYPTVSLCMDGVMNRFQVHTLVLNAFVGPSEGRFCLHADNNPLNNCVDNLSWGTHRANMDQMKRDKRSFRRSMRQFTDDQVREIRASPLSCVKLSRLFHCGHTQIHRIKQRITYADVV